MGKYHYMTSLTSLQIISASIHSIPGVPQEHKDRNVTKCYFAICWNGISELIKKLYQHFRLVSKTAYNCKRSLLVSQGRAGAQPLHIYTVFIGMHNDLFANIMVF